MLSSYETATTRQEKYYSLKMACLNNYYRQIGRVGISLTGILGGTGKRYALDSAKPSDSLCW